MPDRPEVAELAGRYLDGTLTGTETELLNDLLDRDVEARRVFVAITMQSRWMSETFATRLGGEAEPIAPTRGLGPWIIGSIAAAVAVGVTVMVLLMLMDRPAEPDKPTGPAVGVMLAGDGVSWDQDPINDGDDVIAGPLAISAGSIEMQTHAGVALRLSGPGRLDLRDPMHGRLVRGRLSANVPTNAIGFSVETDQVRVIDLGTEFGVTAEPGESDEVHVFTGRVRIERGEWSRVLTAPAAIRVVDGELVAIEPDIWRFPDVAIAHDTPAASIGFDGSEGPWRTIDGVEAVRDGAIKLNGGDVAQARQRTVFVDLDTRTEAPLSVLGLLDDDGRVGRSGTTVWLSWTARGPRRVGDGWAGLSFFEGSDDRATAERLFIGKASGFDAFSYAIPGVSKNDLDVDPDTPGVQVRYTDASVHRFIVRVESGRHVDRVSVWLDPDAGPDGLGAPHAVIELPELRFDRLRFETGGGSGEWRFDDLMIGPTRRSVTETDTR